MSFDAEIAETIRRYLLDKYNREESLDYILAQPRHERVWVWWQALAYFGERRHFQRLEDAPAGIVSITVMGETVQMYTWKDGRYEFLQELTRSELKSIYSE